MRLVRSYFAMVGVFALWVGVWGYLFPGMIGEALPWAVPPLHARFLGSMYLSGATLMFGAMLLPVERSDERFTSLVMATVWTGVLGIVSFLHLGEFDFGHAPVWFWFFAYVAFPIAGAVLAWQARPALIDGVMPAWVRGCAAIQAVACIVLAALLLGWSEGMVAAWPWPISVLLAQLYAGPFLSYGVGSALLWRTGKLDAVRLPLLAMAVFALLVLLASILHLPVMQPLSLADAVWFGGFSLAAGWLVAAVVIAWRRR